MCVSCSLSGTQRVMISGKPDSMDVRDNLSNFDLSLSPCLASLSSLKLFSTLTTYFVVVFPTQIFINIYIYGKKDIDR